MMGPEETTWLKFDLRNVSLGMYGGGANSLGAVRLVVDVPECWRGVLRFGPPHQNRCRPTDVITSPNDGYTLVVDYGPVAPGEVVTTELLLACAVPPPSGNRWSCRCSFERSTVSFERTTLQASVKLVRPRSGRARRSRRTGARSRRPSAPAERHRSPVVLGLRPSRRRRHHANAAKMIKNGTLMAPAGGPRRCSSGASTSSATPCRYGSCRASTSPSPPMCS